MKKIISILGLALLVSSCLSSVTNKTVKKEGVSKKDKAVSILNEAWKAHGFDKMNSKQVYEITAADDWKGLMGKIGKLWPEQKQEMKLQYAFGTFDSRVTFLEGKKKGEQRGLQSWKYYTIPNGDSIPKFKKRAHEKTEFGLAAFQYFFELMDRLKDLELVAYAGEKEFKGNKYDLVFVTWHKLKTHNRHDQYMLWINKETKMMDYVHFTVHGTAFPGNTITGSNEFTSFKSIDGVQIPFEQIIYIGSPKTDQSKYLHKLTVSDFKFDSFDKELLYPNKEVKSTGDSK